MTVPVVTLLFSFVILSLAVPELGVYRGPAPNGPKNMPLYSSWLKKDVVYALEFEAGSYWSDVSGGSWWLEPWSQWVNSAPGKRYLVISVPMLPSREPGVTLAKGASGEYNQYFIQLAKNLVNHNLSNTVVRVGWEFNGDWYSWSAYKDPKSWPIYWRNIVHSMKSVSGQEFKFCWCVSNGWSTGSLVPTDVYPGDEYIDYLGIDIYDASWDKKATFYNFGYFQKGYWYPGDKYTEGDAVEYNNGYWRALENNTGVQPSSGKIWELLEEEPSISENRRLVWNDLSTGSFSISYWSEWAKNHSKPITFNEWGVWNRLDGHGGGDNEFFIEQMFNWIMDPKNQVLFYSYFDIFASDGNHLLYPETPYPAFPKAAQKYLQLFGGH